MPYVPEIAPRPIHLLSTRERFELMFRHLKSDDEILADVSRLRSWPYFDATENRFPFLSRSHREYLENLEKLARERGLKIPGRK